MSLVPREAIDGVTDHDVSRPGTRGRAQPIELGPTQLEAAVHFPILDHGLVVVLGTVARLFHT